MRRILALVSTAACLATTVVACSGADDETDRITRIDGPAQVDDDVRVGPVDDDDPTEG